MHAHGAVLWTEILTERDDYVDNPSTTEECTILLLEANRRRGTDEMRSVDDVEEVIVVDTSTTVTPDPKIAFSN